MQAGTRGEYLLVVLHTLSVGGISNYWGNPNIGTGTGWKDQEGR